jgi:hypothetical protein
MSDTPILTVQTRMILPNETYIARWPHELYPDNKFELYGSYPGGRPDELYIRLNDDRQIILCVQYGKTQFELPLYDITTTTVLFRSFEYNATMRYVLPPIQKCLYELNQYAIGIADAKLILFAIFLNVVPQRNIDHSIHDMIAFVNTAVLIYDFNATKILGFMDICMAKRACAWSERGMVYMCIGKFPPTKKLDTCIEWTEKCIQVRVLGSDLRFKLAEVHLYTEHACCIFVSFGDYRATLTINNVDIGFAEMYALSKKHKDTFTTPTNIEMYKMITYAFNVHMFGAHGKDVDTTITEQCDTILHYPTDVLAFMRTDMVTSNVTLADFITQHKLHQLDSS